MSKFLFDRRFALPAQTLTGESIRFAAKRWSKTAEPRRDGRILICFHGVSALKEHWIPVLERLFSQDDLNISEAWGIDLVNHGDSLQYNTHLLDRPHILNDLSAYGQSLLSLLKSGLIHHETQELILIGHSAGTNPIVRAAMAYIHAGEPIPFKTAVIMEPVFLPAKVAEKAVGRYKPNIEAHKWQWPSRQEAEEFIHGTQPWKGWHKEIRDLHIEYGMVHSAVTGSQLKCPSFIEAGCYPNADVQAQALSDFPLFCEKIGAHLVYGSRDDFIPKQIHDAFVASVKDKLRSVQYVKDTGHMIVQLNPDGCAEVLSNIIRGLDSSSSLSSPDLQARL